MKKTKKTTRRMLINYYDDETYQMCKNLSHADAFRWLTRANQFLNKIVGIEKRLENEEAMRKMGW
jgi:hypothetical protein